MKSTMMAVLAAVGLASGLTAGEVKRIDALKGECEQALRKRDYAAALEACAQIRAATNATPREFCWAWAKEGDIFKAQGKKAEALGRYNQLMESLTDRADTGRKAIDCLSGVKRFEYVERVIREDWRYGLSNREKSKLWDKYAYDGYMQLEPERMWKGREESLKLGGVGGDYAGRLVQAKSCWDDLKTFPIDESEVKWPKTLADFGYTPNGRTVRVSKDFGFDPVNSTDYLMAALTSGASRVVIDNVGKPWYTRQLKVPSNVEIVLEKGVRVHTDRTWKEFKKGGIFHLNCVSNVIIRGECENDHDVVLSQFHDLADRCKHCRNYGRSGICIDNSRNVCVKNMRIAEMAEDALMFGGLWGLNRNMYFENLDLDSCFRQACSLCNDDRTFFRKVRFRGTAGAEPGAGIDLEPAETCQGNASVYLYDCTFENNLGGGLLFSTSSELPITLHAKRCTFEAQRHGDLMVFIRIGCYLGNNKKVPGRAIFEGCTFKGYSDLSPVRVDGISLLDLTFRDCVIRDIGKTLDRDGKPDASAVSFYLNRDIYYEGHEKGYPEATVDFGNLRVEGYTNAPPITYRNQAGHVAIRNLKGTIDFNGKKVAASKYVWNGPDNALRDIAADVPKFSDAQAVKPVAGKVEPTFKFTWDGGWWSARPQINYCFHGGKGKRAKFNFRYAGQLWGRKDITVSSASGEKFALGTFAQGDNAVEFEFPATGWYSIEPPMFHALTDYEGIVPVYFTGAGKMREVQFDAALGYVGYFEVPANGEATLKVKDGAIEIRDAKGELFGKYASSAYTGSAYAKLKSKSGRNEVWSFTLYDRACIKFFAPFSGVWADCPEAVPTTADAIRTPVVKLDARSSDDDGKPVATADVGAILKAKPVLAKIVRDEAKRLAAWAKLGEFTELAKNERALLKRMRSGALNEQVQKEIADEEKNLPPLELLEAQEARVAKMTPAQLERYAFVNVFAVMRGFYFDQSFAGPFIRCLWEGADMKRDYRDIYWCIYKKDFEDYIRHWMGEFKLGYAEFTVICDDDAKLDKVIPVLETYATACTPNDLKAAK